MKSVHKIQKDKTFNENFILQWQNEKWPKNSQILQNGQMRFFMANALQKWPNFSKLAMKWSIWQPCSFLLRSLLLYYQCCHSVVTEKHYIS